MSNYKVLIPVAMVVLYLLSGYMLIQDKGEKLEQYNTALAAAREYREQEIRVDAQAEYLRAYGMTPSTELALEISQFYEESFNRAHAISWLEEAVGKFYEESALYEELFRMHYMNQDYIGCYNICDLAEKRGVNSEYISEKEREIAYTYYFSGSYTKVGAFSEGKAPVCIEDSWGFADTSGSKVIATMFEEVGAFSDNLAPVKDKDGDVYFIDTQGNKKKSILTEETVEALTMTADGIYAVYNGKTWSFYKDKSEYLFGPYDAVSSIGNGIAAVKKDNKWSLINRNGETISNDTYDSVVMDEKGVVYRNDRLFVENGYKFSMIDAEGTVVSKQSYEDARLFNDSTLAAVRLNDKWGYVDKDGNMVIEPKYEDARSFMNGLAAVKYGNFWGYINRDGEMVITPSFDDAKDFNSSGSAFVLRGDRWELLRLYKYNH